MLPNRAAVIAFCAKRHNEGDTLYFQIIAALTEWFLWGDNPEEAMERYLAATDAQERVEVRKSKVRAWRAAQGRQPTTNTSGNKGDTR